MSTESSATKRVFSGIQPSGAIHLGNYLGAISQWVDMQGAYDAVFCIVDLHALTVPKEPGVIAEGTLAIGRILLALGIDPEQATLFVQSHVRQHTELAWMMQAYTAYGELSRMTQFKEKSEQQAGYISTGLFTYPTLQAADILLYDTDVVPVGDDQRQHIELTRDAALRFNARHGETFVIPEHRIPQAGARIMDLQHPENKMSKSVDSPAGTIGLLDTPKEIEKKLKRAVTDTDGEVRFDRVNKPGVSNLLEILAAATGGDPVALAERYQQYGPLKADAAEALISLLEPFQARYNELEDGDVRAAFRTGAAKAVAVAEPVMERVRVASGLLI
ncbi:MAG: tryptophan--tRNA ligase [Acidimicrobiales bacterium]